MHVTDNSEHDESATQKLIAAGAALSPISLENRLEWRRRHSLRNIKPRALTSNAMSLMPDWRAIAFTSTAAAIADAAHLFRYLPRS